MNLFLILSISVYFLPTGNSISAFSLNQASKNYNTSFTESETKKNTKKSKDPLDFNWECLFIDCETQNTKNITKTQNLNDGENCKSNSECISSFCNNDHVCFTPISVKKLNLGDKCNQNNDCSDTFVCLEDPNQPEFKICQANKTKRHAKTKLNINISQCIDDSDCEQSKICKIDQNNGINNCVSKNSDNLLKLGEKCNNGNECHSNICGFDSATFNYYMVCLKTESNAQVSIVPLPLLPLEFIEKKMNLRKKIKKKYILNI